jgi:hypothetical protein
MGLGDDRETVLGLAANHSTICKFEDANGEDYRHVWKSIRLLANNAIKQAQQLRALEKVRTPESATTVDTRAFSGEQKTIR